MAPRRAPKRAPSTKPASKPGEKAKDVRTDAELSDQPESGSGTFVLDAGDGAQSSTTYAGDWKVVEGGRKCRHGKGRLILFSGDVYEGDFVEDQFHGVGKMTFTSGASYEGDFVQGEFQGQGAYTFPNGSMYEGSFEGNKMHGEGVFKSAAGIFRGNFVENSGPGLREHYDLS